MTNNEWRFLDVFGVKERKLEWITSPRRKMLEQVSSAYVLARLKVSGSISPAASPHKKPATRGGGRKRLVTEDQRFYLIGRSVDQQLPKFEFVFKLLRELKILGGDGDLNVLRSGLTKHHFTQNEIDIVIQARTPMGSAKRFVAKSLTSRAHPNGISLQTVNSAYSRYLKALKSKRTLL